MIWLGLALALLFVPLGCNRTGPPATALLTESRHVRQDSIHVDTMRFGRFGPVVLYRATSRPSHVVLLVSGDGGWNLGVVRMAELVARMDALVVGIDIRRYLGALGATKERCSYPAADFEALSQWLQRKLAFPKYTEPVLLGYSSGATLVYAALAQAPPSTFRGAISLGFCPALRASRSFCRGYGLPSMPAGRLRWLSVGAADSVSAPWIVLQGEDDSTCSAAVATRFVRQVHGGDIVLLPKVGHGFGVEARWVPQLTAVFERMVRAPMTTVAPSAPAVRDLPLVELRTKEPARELAVIVSGDGGWASLDRQIGETLAAKGVPVVGLNSLQYFWKARTPEQAATDLTRILRHYLWAWHASDVLLIGYSRGAEVLPFMVTRLPADLRNRVRAVALVAPGLTAGFEWHLADLLGGTSGGGLPTVPEIRQLRGLRVLCLYGADERESACRALPSGVARSIELPGGHHFGGAYREVARRILEAAAGT
jgi:type IV secretory pathway VirJ component